MFPELPQRKYRSNVPFSGGQSMNLGNFFGFAVFKLKIPNFLD